MSGHDRIDTIPAATARHYQQMAVRDRAWEAVERDFNAGGYLDELCDELGPEDWVSELVHGIFWRARSRAMDEGISPATADRVAMAELRDLFADAGQAARYDQARHAVCERIVEDML
ncbi:MAG: hypothetical protein U9R79_05920 [Armatimonadota bacterium]|nr:hypothetical protein [Armatimonadota bacterium]